MGPPERGLGSPLPPEVGAAVPPAHASPPPSFPQGSSRPTRSLSTAQLAQPSGGLQASVISNIVLMKGQAKVSEGHCQQKLLDGHRLLTSRPVQGRRQIGTGVLATGVRVEMNPWGVGGDPVWATAGQLLANLVLG